jgi:hypothetical protein
MTNENINLKPVLWLLFLVLVLFGLYQMCSGLVVSQTTGMLLVDTPKPFATISISQNNKGAAIVGTGTAKVRLAPGTYLIVASDAGSRDSTVIKISKKQTIKTYLNFKSPPLLKSPANINYKNVSALINNGGITTLQASQLEQYFFNYKPSAHTVSIDPDSVEPGPRNPNTSTTFTLNFNVTIDSTQYKATTSYANLSTIRLSLYNPQTNALVFDSGVPATSPEGGA